MLKHIVQTVESSVEPLKKRVENVLDMATRTVTSLANTYLPLPASTYDEAQPEKPTQEGEEKDQIKSEKMDESVTDKLESLSMVPASLEEDGASDTIES